MVAEAPEETHETHETRDDEEHLSELTHPALANTLKFVSVVYLMTLTSMGIVFTLSLFLRGGTGQVDSTYLWVFNTYLSLTGIIFLVYLNVKLRQFKEKPNYDSYNERPKPPVYTINLTTELEASQQKGTDKSGNTHEHNTIERANNNDPKGKALRSIIKARNQPPLQYGGPGVNFFLRLGAIGFALGSVLLDALRITHYFQTPTKNECYGNLYVLQCSTRLLMILLETHFIFKHHKIIINFQHVVMWFGFLHLISSNLILWIGTVITEGYQGFEHSLTDHGSEDGHPTNTTNVTDSHQLYKRASATSDVCAYDGVSLFETLSHYLYPLAIEFALIGAAVLYKVVSNLGAYLNPLYVEWEATHHYHSRKIHNHECQKATSGVFSGLLVFTTMFAVTLAFMILEDEDLQTYLYVGGNLAVHVVAFIANILAFSKTSTLTFAGDAENPLDEYLIVVCLSGVYFLSGAEIIAAFDALGDGTGQEAVKILYLVGGFVTVIQATFQVIFIIDGLRREAITVQQQREKPGRALISFLLFSNLAMWVVNSFQLKETYQIDFMRNFYGELAWTIILYITLPLAVFFRFHSVACLSDIWIEAYKKRCHSVFKIKSKKVKHTPKNHDKVIELHNVNTSESCTDTEITQL